MPNSFYNLVISLSTNRLSFAFFSMTFITILYSETNSATIASAVTLTTTIASITCGIFLPSFTQVYSPKTLLYFSQIAQIIIFILLVLLFSTNLSTYTIIILLILNFFLGLFYAINTPIKNSIVPKIINKNKIVRANSIISFTDQTLLLIGWSLGGVLIATLGNTTLLFISFFLLLISLTSLYFMVIPKKTLSIIKKTKRFSIFIDTWSKLFTTPKIRTITLIDIINGFGATVWIGAVTLAFVTEVYQLDKSWWGYINSAYFSGTILGGIIIWKLASKVHSNFKISILLSTLILGILTIMYSLITIPFIGLILVIMMGPFFQLISISSRSYIQLELEKEDLAAIFASRATLNQIVFSLSIFIIGISVDLLGPQFAYFISGGLQLSATIIGYFSFKIDKA